jgi:hypothetical protein
MPDRHVELQLRDKRAGVSPKARDVGELPLDGE